MPKIAKIIRFVEIVMMILNITWEDTEKQKSKYQGRLDKNARDTVKFCNFGKENKCYSIQNQLQGLSLCVHDLENEKYFKVIYFDENDLYGKNYKEFENECNDWENYFIPAKTEMDFMTIKTKLTKENL